MKILLINIFIIACMPFVFAGVINRVKAFWSGRKGPSVFQPFFDFMKYLKKGRVISATTGAVFALAPVAVFSSALTAALLIPLCANKAVFSFAGDFIVFAYLLALGKFFIVAAALDTGSPFEGMGASREAFFSALVEPGFMALFATLSIFALDSSFSSVAGALYSPAGPFKALIILLAACALFLIMLAEGSRVPVDDPNTHLELTMIHEVMVLDNSGPDMALISYAVNLKMTLFICLITLVIVPAGLPAWLSAAVLLAAIIAGAAAAGCVESLMARLRMTHVPQFLLVSVSAALAVASITLLVVFGGLK